MSVRDQCIAAVLTATSCDEYDGKWIPTVAWKQILFLTTNEEYKEQTVTKALKQTKYNLESVSTSDFKIFHEQKWVKECSLPNQKYVKKFVNFFYIHVSSKTYPLAENETQTWQERYNFFM